MSKSRETIADTTADASEPEVSRNGNPWRRRRVSRWVKLWWAVRALILVVFAPVLMALIAIVMLIGQEVTAPSWIVRDVEARASQVLGGGSLEFRAVKFTVGTDLHPQLVLEGSVLRDATGSVLARVPHIEGQLSPRGAVQGRALIQELRLVGAQVSLRRAQDGTLALAFEQGARPVGAADNFVELLEQIDAIFDQGALEALEQVRADGLIINYTDERASRSWIVDDGRIELDVNDDVLDLRANLALLSGRAFVTTAQLSYTSPRGSPAGAIALSINNAAAADIASQSPLLSWLSVLDAPISGFLRSSVDANGAPRNTSATLQIGKGELRPAAQALPIPFQSARTYLTYNPLREELMFDLLEVDSDWGQFSGTAKTYLREYVQGRPEAILGQVQFSTMTLLPDGMFEDPIALSDGAVDFRLRLDPFTLDIGQIAVNAEDALVHVAGRVRAGFDGWTVALDSTATQIEASKVLALWPPSVAPGTRKWLEENVLAGTFEDVQLSVRTRTGFPPTLATTFGYSDAQVRVLKTLPPIENARGLLSLVGKRLSVTLEDGYMTAPQGGRIDLTGSTFVIPETGPRAPARVDLALAGQMTAGIALLDLPPFSVLRNSDLPPSFAEGTARVTAVIETPLGRDILPEERTWSARADLRNLRTDVLVPDRTLTASALTLRVDPTSLVVQGPVQLSGVGGTMTFSRALGPGSEGTARVEAGVTIGPDFLNAFNITLPPGMVTGAAPAQIAIDLSDPAAAGFRLTSDLRGVGLNLGAVGWSKSRNAAGALTVTGQLGAAARIDQLSLTAPGLQTTGTLTLARGGGLDRAVFGRVRLGGWLDAPVTLVGRGAGQPVGVQISGGTLDLRRANFGGGGGNGNGGGGGGSGQSGPINIRLNTLQVTDAIAVNNFEGAFTSPSGLQGQFTGNVNGSAPIRGRLAPSGGRSAVRIVSDDAGSLLRATGLMRTAYGGDLELTLVPAAAAGSYDGDVEVNTLRIRDAPALASLLDAISVVGLFAQLNGQGLLFNDVDAKFRLTPNQVIVTESSAVGPGLGISLDGIYATASRTMDFQGVVSPFYILNGIGSFLTRRGEGLIGFNFNLRGAVDSPQVSVNPLSALTPGMFREIFRRPPPTVGN
ncbi:AsmA-like C-terminal region-containing protein [Octadecabacter sp.]|nr:AsmA-like C-terminal region-containing protein [Octadecabacter sp.]